VLGACAAEWLKRPGRISGTTPADAARASAEGFEKVLRALDRLQAERRVQQERAAAAAAAQDDLRRATAKVFDETRPKFSSRAPIPLWAAEAPSPTAPIR